MELIVRLDDFAARFAFDWRPLRAGGKNCYAWGYDCRPKPLEDEPVIYRHVLETRSAGVVPIYIGEGASLAGPQKAHICFQYGGPHGGTPHGSTRHDVRTYIGGRTENGWTEILRMQSPVINLSDARVRKFLQVTLIAAHYWRHEELARRYNDMPMFLNKPT
jgi:hypothetical protein